MSSLPFFVNVLAEEQAALELPRPDSKPASLPVPNPSKSFWIDTPEANPLAKEGSTGPLTEESDICIIGSGITGVSAAYHISRLLAERGPSSHPLNITILEARDFCSGATGRNGGHLTPNGFHNFVDYASLFGTDDAIRAVQLEKYTASSLVELIHNTSKPSAVDLVAGGHTTLLFTEAEIVTARADYEAAKAAGIDVSSVRFLTREETRETYGASYPSVRMPGHNVWPLKLVTHLYRLADEIGTSSRTSSLRLHTSTPVTAITPLSSDASSRSGPHRWTLTTPRGRIACTAVLHATNAYASALLPHMHGPSGIVPARGQVIATRAAVSLEELTASGWGGNEGFEYWFPRPVSAPDERPLVILGGGRESTGPDFELYTVDDAGVSGTVGETLRRFLPAVFPGKYEAGREPEMEWTGIMGFTKTADPFVGRVLDPKDPSGQAYAGQYIAAGYTGHGMTRAYGCAEAVAQLIVADLSGEEWTVPEWLPRHHLTQNRLQD